MSKGKNKKIRKRLEEQYGKGCFFERAHVAERIAARGGIATFKVFVEEKRYKGKAISYQITLHHLQHRSEGGPTTVENGANVSDIAHQYLHSLNRQDEEIINDMLREFKINCVIMRGDGEVQEAKSIEVEIPKSTDEDVLIIPVYNNTPEQETKRQALRDKSYKRDKVKNPSRAAKKRELRKLIEEEEEENLIDF